MNPSFPVLLHIHHFLLVNPTDSHPPRCSQFLFNAPTPPRWLIPNPSSVLPSSRAPSQFLSTAPHQPHTKSILGDLIFSHSSPVLPVPFQCSEFPASCPHLHPKFLLGSPSAPDSAPYSSQCLILLALYPTSVPPSPLVLLHPSQSFPVPLQTLPASSQTLPVTPRLPRHPSVSSTTQPHLSLWSPSQGMTLQTQGGSGPALRHNTPPPTVCPSMSQYVLICPITSQHPFPAPPVLLQYNTTQTHTHTENTAQ